MAEDLFLVFSNPVDGQENAYTDWYKNTHLGDVLKVPGVVTSGEMVLHEALDMASVSMATWRPAGRRQISAAPVH